MKAFKAISQTFRVCIKSFLLFQLCLLGGALFGAGLEGLIYLTSGDGVYGLSVAFAIMALAIMVMFGSVFGGYGDFAMAVFFGRSRKHYLFTKYIYYVVEYFVAGLILLGVYKLESLLSGDDDLVFELDGKIQVAALVIFVLPIFIILFSALYAKFERKFFWFVWALWMVIMAGGPRMLSAMENHPESVIAKIGFFLQKALLAGSTESLIVVAILAAIGIILNITIYRNVDVRD